ncbi:solute-binding protein [Acrocarpospora corrugata]|uniref:Solute-binding protein n=1 Tax=Acrocarpospora corrugata TaxID=35763 RepID=A0A5M3W456_9ACTN|nr:solute-binding protein [Acrocarpospora corrugata]
MASAALLVAGAVGCAVMPGSGGGTDTAGDTPPLVDEGFKIGLLLPESETTRYEKFDRPYITRSIKELCPDCTVLHHNAGGDSGQQQQQIDKMITHGVKVLILDAVDAETIAPSVTKAKQQGVKVIAYDRLAEGPIDSYTSFDNVEVGRMQGQALLEALEKGGNPTRGPIVMINGAPADPNAGEFKEGAHAVLDGNVRVGREFDTPDWSPEQAGIEATAAFAALGVDQVIGVYSANDGMAGGIAEAIRLSGAKPGTPLTGQDAELAAIQRILLGTQTMTIYKPIMPQAQSAAHMAIDLAAGRRLRAPTTVSNSTVKGIPSMVIAPMVVTRDNIKGTVVQDGFWSVKEICAPEQLKAACKSTGLI